jgi:hypothetical protein
MIRGMKVSLTVILVPYKACKKSMVVTNSTLLD